MPACADVYKNPNTPLFISYGPFYRHIKGVQAMKKVTGQDTEMVLNEFIPFVGDWCDLSTVEPHDGKPATRWVHTRGVVLLVLLWMYERQLKK